MLTSSGGRERYRVKFKAAFIARQNFVLKGQILMHSPLTACIRVFVRYIEAGLWAPKGCWKTSTHPDVREAVSHRHMAMRRDIAYAVSINIVVIAS